MIYKHYIMRVKSDAYTFQNIRIHISHKNEYFMRNFNCKFKNLIDVSKLFTEYAYIK